MSEYNTGEVFASGATNSVHVGGIVGNQQYSGQIDALIQDAYNTGTIRGRGTKTSLVGGIAGTNTGGIIQNVYNLGSLSAETTEGGLGPTTAGVIVGRNNKHGNYGGVVSYAYHASGNISGKNKGAIVGSSGSTGTFAHVLFEKKDAEGNDLSDALVGGKGRDSLKILQPFCFYLQFLCFIFYENLKSLSALPFRSLCPIGREGPLNGTAGLDLFSRFLLTYCAFSAMCAWFWPLQNL